MLVELYIKNFITIDEQRISFDKGLHVFTGETGAGKSVVLQALEVALGGRFSPKLIRQGTEESLIEAQLDLSLIAKHKLASLPEIAGETELTISRSFNQKGRGKVYINGRLSSVSQLSLITDLLINICSQGHQMELLKEALHVNVLDEYAELGELVAEYSLVFKNWSEKKVSLKLAEDRAREAARRSSELEFIIQDLENSGVGVYNREELESELKKISSAETLMTLSASAVSMITENQGLAETMDSLVSVIKKISDIDPSLSELFKRSTSLEIELSEIARDIETYAASISLDEDAITGIRDKLSAIASLERKYKTNSAGLEEILRDYKHEFSLIEDNSFIQKLSEELSAVETVLRNLATELSKKRKTAAKSLEKQISQDFIKLNMKGASIQVNFEPCNIGPSGFEKISFKFLSHKKQVPRALSEAASGGELSRIMLILKKAIKDKTGVNVLVFDEVDVGVSGSVARAVGEMLKTLSQTSQVICITHLPQVASLADIHYLVSKASGNPPKSSILSLEENPRIEEIARMLAGYTITPAARESAKELLSSNLR